MKKRFQLTIGAGALILLVSAFFATMTFAADPTPTSTTQTLGQQFITKLAQKLGISEDKLSTAVKDSGNEIVDEQVASGKITQGEADQLKQRIDSSNGDFFPFGGMRGHRGGSGLKGMMGTSAADLSTFLGITEAQLRTELQSGKNLAQVAEAHGKTADQLKTYITDQAKKNLDQAVKDGKITQAQEDSMMSNLSSRIDSMINGTMMGRGMFGRGWGGCPFNGGNGTQTTPTSTGNL